MRETRAYRTAQHPIHSFDSPPGNAAGGYGARVPPDPIPNSEVKPRRADGTAGLSRWESTSPPISSIETPPSESVRWGAFRRPGAAPPPSASPAERELMGAENPQLRRARPVDPPLHVAVQRHRRPGDERRGNEPPRA